MIYWHSFDGKWDFSLLLFMIFWDTIFDYSTDIEPYMKSQHWFSDFFEHYLSLKNDRNICLGYFICSYFITAICWKEMVYNVLCISGLIEFWFSTLFWHHWLYLQWYILLSFRLCFYLHKLLCTIQRGYILGHSWMFSIITYLVGFIVETV